MAGRNDSTPIRGKLDDARTSAAVPAPELLTVKQQRAARRAKKVATFKRQQAGAKRRRLVVAITVGAAGVAVATLIIVLVVTSGAPKMVPAAIDGVRTFSGLASTHVPSSVNYPQTPPVGGPHSQAWLNCGVYSQPVPNENAVHSLEHGAVWVTYDPNSIADDKLTALRKMVPASYAILSPLSKLPSPIVASAWGTQLQADGVDDPRIAEFIAKYRNTKAVPEPGGACTGGVEGPGKVS